MAQESAGRRPIFRNWLTLAGFVITVGGFFAFLLLFAIDLFADHSNPYMGILAYVVAPGFMFLGLVVGCVGIWIARRESRAPGGPRRLIIDLSKPAHRRTMGGFVACGILFLLVTAIGSTRTYRYTSSTQFCGQACHEPMKPEYTTYQHSPHARVECTACHVGPGAGWYVKSKINGVRQLYATLVNDFERPIKSPMNLRPAQDTCEQCHWPQRDAGTLDRTYHHFLSDETNTPFSVRLLLKVGGGDPSRGPAGGIHWHMNLANKVEYIATDERRQVIPWVRFTDPSGNVTEYRTADFKDEPAKHQIRIMDCIDCHNRPAHRFQAPNDAVDVAMAAKRIDPALPWVKSNTVFALLQNYATENEALEKIEASLRKTYSQATQVESLVREARNIYRKNFFPEMRSDWRAYPDNLNHKDGAGCFRCHDGLHKTADGKRSIKASDCNSCHTILAQGSGEQLTKLNPEGHKFFHIDSINEDFSCNTCHTGGIQKE
jgi:hypothetical protein